MSTAIERDSMEFDVIIVGAGPAGLATACRLKQLAEQNSYDLSVCVVEKGSEVGAHILSGAVLETRALDELFPDWQQQGAPITTQVTRDEVYFLNSDSKQTRLPTFAYPKTMHNTGNYIVSMGNVCRWLAEKAEALGVEVFAGFPAAEVLIEENEVKGIVTADMGIGKDGKHKDTFEPGIELRARFTVFAEGSRGHLGKKLIAHYALDKDKSPQHYALGFKEIWDIPAEQHEQGLVIHTAGWPLSQFGAQSSGGAYLYHGENNQILLGLIVDLNYQNPHLNPYEEFQRLKHHPLFANYLHKGKRVSYGARAITKGGINSLPTMAFPGGFLVGCNAGTLNFAKIKGNHTAMKSGMLAAEAIIEQWQTDSNKADYSHAFKASWAYRELEQARNFGPAIHKFGVFFGGVYNTIEQNLFGGKTPFTFYDKQSDHNRLAKAQDSAPIEYKKADGILSFDRLSSVYLSNTDHEEDQPCHLQLTDADIPIKVNFTRYNEPAQRYCPAGVYELIEQETGDPQLQINAQNCIHCKTCDIKDPSQNITWVSPEGSGGPNYPNM